MKNLSIRRLRTEDSRPLSRMLCSGSRAYQEYFIPFAFDEPTVSGLLANAVRDGYWGVWIDDELAGFFMLRGFDAGFAVPAYGVSIAESHAGKGLLKLTLQYALSWCKVNGIARIMLKVHPENAVARTTYEKFGFEFQGVDPKNMHRIYSRAV